MLRPHSYQPPEDGLPPNEVRLLDLQAQPWPEDGHRVRIQLDVTPFLERPNLEVVIKDENGIDVSSISIVESIDAHMTFTMHIRSAQLSDRYTIFASLHYPDIGKVDEKDVPLVMNKKAE